ncbi:hypothetical protein [Methanoregula sp.]|uniref:hypothetical protein n=1 Tax=Methanoregula sp. TaxID=2052170 RepID=UPI002C563787|nr:hypothetical protein [Methanoregula sp.]HVP96118.1 hypothetical protein [Methanoregula sp.]
MNDKRQYITGLTGAGVLCVFIFLIIAAGCTANSPAGPQQGTVTPDQAAIIAAANNCTETSVTITDAVGTFRYTSTTNCSLTKTLVQLNASEMQEMKTLLEGKNMTCWYTKGSFDPRLVTSLVGGIEYCSGDLKDDITKLMLFT